MTTSTSIAYSGREKCFVHTAYLTDDTSTDGIPFVPSQNPSTSNSDSTEQSGNSADTDTDFSDSTAGESTVGGSTSGGSTSGGSTVGGSGNSGNGNHRSGGGFDSNRDDDDFDNPNDDVNDGGTDYSDTDHSDTVCESKQYAAFNSYTNHIGADNIVADNIVADEFNSKAIIMQKLRDAMIWINAKRNIRDYTPLELLKLAKSCKVVIEEQDKKRYSPHVRLLAKEVLEVIEAAFVLIKSSEGKFGEDIVAVLRDMYLDSPRAVKESLANTKLSKTRYYDLKKVAPDVFEVYLELTPQRCNCDNTLRNDSANNPDDLSDEPTFDNKEEIL